MSNTNELDRLFACWSEGHSFDDFYIDVSNALRDNAAELQRLRAAVAMGLGTTPQAQPAREPQGWQPIETAPEETEILIGAFIDGVFKFGRSVMFYEQANEFAGETWSGWVWSVDDCNDSVAENPTHWMPLPDAPIEANHGIKENQS